MILTFIIINHDATVVRKIKLILLGNPLVGTKVL